MKQHAAESLFQTIPPLYPSSPFPSIDYVRSPSAEILDAIAAVLILWTTAAIVSRLMTIPFGKNTRTIVLNRIFDRVLNFSFASCNRFKDSRQHKRRSFTTSSLQIWSTAVLFLLVLCIAEVLVIFSQTYQQKARSLDDLNLKSLTFQIPENGTEVTGHFVGCVPLLSGERTSTSHVYSLCLYQEVSNGKEVAQRTGFQFQFKSSDAQFFEIYESHSFIDVRTRVSVEIRDPMGFAMYYANMTRLGFSMTSTKLRWLSRKLKEICALCEVNTEIVSPTLSFIRSDLNPIINKEENMDTAIRFSFHVQSMLRLSAKQLKIEDFLNVRGQDDDNKKVLIEMTVGRVKRVSGLMLWIALAVLAIINFVASRVTDDLEDDVHEVLATLVGSAPGESLWDCPNIRFSIIDGHPPSIQRQNGEESEGDSLFLVKI